jgi:hypothetical protein
LFANADLVVVGRQIPQVKFCQDPSSFLSSFRDSDVRYKLAHTFEGKTLFGGKTGLHVIEHEVNKAAAKNRSITQRPTSRIHVLPPLRGDGLEAVSSTKLRLELSRFLNTMWGYGYSSSDASLLLALSRERRTRFKAALERPETRQHWVGDAKQCGEWGVKNGIPVRGVVTKHKG